MAEAIEKAVLQTLAQEAGGVPDTGAFAEQHGFDHAAVVGVMKSLLMAEMLAVQVRVWRVAWSGRRGVAASPPAAAAAALNTPHSPPSTHTHTLHHHILQDIDHSRWALTDEARGYLDTGSPEAQVFAAVPADGGIALPALKVSVCACACVRVEGHPLCRGAHDSIGARAC